jgi:predicted aspartyl protease
MLTRAVLADGSEVTIHVFEGSVVWDGQEQTVAVLATDGDALVGMAMHAGYRLTLDVEDNGAVHIEALR